jgi:hypothetical protein
MIDNGANDWNAGLLSAAKNDRYLFVERMLAYGATNLNDSLKAAFDRRNPEIVSFLLVNGATNADKVFDGAADSAFLLHMLTTTTGAKRPALAAVPKIQAYVFDRADVLADRLRNRLDFLPRVLRSVVVDYCINLW